MIGSVQINKLNFQQTFQLLVNLIKINWKMENHSLKLAAQYMILLLNHKAMMHSLLMLSWF